MNPVYSSGELKDKMAWVIGLARSGFAAAKLLRLTGAEVFVTERSDASNLGDMIAELEAMGVEVQVGGHDLKGKTPPDFAVVSPGIPLSAPVIQWLRDRGRPVYSEIEVAYWFYYGTTVAITGTNGKTTVTRWLTHMLREAGLDARAAGNIGYPFCDLVREKPRTTHAITEVSSYQLESIASFHPHVSVLTNITADHLERHGSMKNYAAAKGRVFENQEAEDFAVMPYGGELVATISSCVRARKLLVSMDRVPHDGTGFKDGFLWLSHDGKKVQLMEASDLPIPGMHNVANALCASAAAWALQLSVDEIRKGLLTFKGVEHRLETIKSNGRIWINDSKATNVDSLKVALEAVKGKVWLIAGGKDKGAPYEPLRNLVKEKVKRLLLIGEGADRIQDELGDLVQAEMCATLDNAVKLANLQAEHGDTVLLSPACASFDQYENFEVRGEAFRKLVEEVTA